MDIDIKEEENDDSWPGSDDDDDFIDHRSSSSKRGASSGSENRKKKMKLEANEVKRPNMSKITKGSKSELKLCEELITILNPVKDNLLELPLNAEKLNQIVKWAEDVKIKFILKKAQVAADEVVENTELQFTESKIATPKVSMLGTTFLCNVCDKYEGYASDVTHHYFSDHYEWCVYSCKLCDPGETFNKYSALRAHILRNHKNISKEENEKQLCRHKYMKRVLNYLHSVVSSAHSVVQMYNPPKVVVRRSTAHSQITDEEKKEFFRLFGLQNQWRLDSIFLTKMPLLSMDKGVTVFRKYVHFKDCEDKDFPDKFVYMYPSYIIKAGRIKISYTIGCSAVQLNRNGLRSGWNSALRRVITRALTFCASASRANDNKKKDDDKKKEMSFILPQFAIIIYWTEPGTDIEGNEKSANISLKMDGRNLMAKDFDTFFVALYSEGNISQDANNKMKTAITAGANKIKLKVDDYLAQAAKK